MRLLTQGEDACNALAGPLTPGSAHCALLRVVMAMRLAGLPRNAGALALNIPPQSWKRNLSSTSCVLTPPSNGPQRGEPTP
jgi:hypothetical protein